MHMISAVRNHVHFLLKSYGKKGDAYAKDNLSYHGKIQLCSEYGLG